MQWYLSGPHGSKDRSEVALELRDLRPYFWLQVEVVLVLRQLWSQVLSRNGGKKPNLGWSQEELCGFG